MACDDKEWYFTISKKWERQAVHIPPLSFRSGPSSAGVGGGGRHAGSRRRPSHPQLQLQHHLRLPHLPNQACLFLARLAAATVHQMAPLVEYEAPWPMYALAWSSSPVISSNTDFSQDLTGSGQRPPSAAAADTPYSGDLRRRASRRGRPSHRPIPEGARLAVGSFFEEYANRVQILGLEVGADGCVHNSSFPPRHHVTFARPFKDFWYCSCCVALQPDCSRLAVS